MANRKLKLKQRVQFLGENGPKEKEATIVVLDGGSGKPVGVEFEKPIAHGHSCDGKAKPGHGWWCLPEELGEV